MRRFEEFSVKIDGADTKFKMYEPTLEDQKEANKVRNTTFYEAIKSGNIKLTELLKQNCSIFRFIVKF